ncbi:MAG: hypothetical protein HY074_16115 [Deltaproteobacteria bacterium]|nr:hypothetical protein [Deltaproteobacteria bacterium]
MQRIREDEFEIVVFLRVPDMCLVCHYLWHVNTPPSNTGNGTLVTRALAGGEDLPFHESRLLGVVKNFRISRRTRLRLLLLAIWKRQR